MAANETNKSLDSSLDDIACDYNVGANFKDFLSSLKTVNTEDQVIEEDANAVTVPSYGAEATVLHVVENSMGRTLRGSRARRGRSTQSHMADVSESIYIHDSLEEDITSTARTTRNSRVRGSRKRRSNLDNEGNVQGKQTHIIGETIAIPDSPEPSDIQRAAGLGSAISISSEEELDSTFNISVEDDENYEVPVRVWWKFGNVDRFVIRRYQKLASVFEHYAKKENLPQNQILLTLNNVSVQPTDTPDSLKLTITSTLEGGVTTFIDKTDEPITGKEPALGEDEIELKIQHKTSKKPLLIRIMKTQKMRVLLLKCAESLELSEDKLKLIFDGEALDLNETPEDLDLEGGECIDLRIAE